MATDASLKRRVVEVWTEGAFQDVATLGAGDYHWGVFAEDSPNSAPRPLFRSPRKVSVTRAAKARFRTVEVINDWGQ